MTGPLTESHQQTNPNLAIAFALLFIPAVLTAQVQPAPGWCSMAHCNNQMTDFEPLTPIGLTGPVYVMNRDTSANGARLGLACTTNGTNFACSYRQYPAALVYYDADGHTLWNSGFLLDANIDFAAPLVQADGSVVIGDDLNIFKFNSNGTVAWSTPSPGGQPVSLITTPNGAIVSATDQVSVSVCWQNNCQLQFGLANNGSGYTTASVLLSGGDCPGAAATATVSNGMVTGLTLVTQGPSCIVPPDIVIQGDGVGAVAISQLIASTPVAVYNGTTGALVGSMYLYASGNSGPYYLTANTPCVNNGSYPNRVYVSMNLSSNSSLAALWALDINPTSPTNPITPAWSYAFQGPSGASPLCVGNNIYFDGRGAAGGPAGTTIFGLTDTGTAPQVVFTQYLGAKTGIITSNFALDPRPVGGFWHEIQGNPSIFHRDFSTGAVIESINVGALLQANGAPPGNYWPSGVFTTYGTTSYPYLLMGTQAMLTASYFAMVDLTQGTLVWALPIDPGNSPFNSDSAEGMSAMAVDAGGRSVIAIADRYSGAFFVTQGAGTVAISTTSLSFGNVALGSSSPAENILVTNNASAVLNISSISASGDFSQTNNCPASLPPGIGCTIAVTFSPTVAGPRTGAVTITDNATGSPHTISLSGSGITAQPAINLSSSSLSFAAQAVGTTSPAQTVTLTNGGTGPLTLANIVASGDALQTNSCVAAVMPGAYCLINVMFAPAATGTRSGMITITGNAPNSPQTITMAGTGTPTPAAAAGLSSTSLNFSGQKVGVSTGVQSVTLTNPGTATLIIASIVSSGDATDTTTCTASLAPGASCTISISMTPAAIGPRTGTITLTDSAPDSPQTIAVMGGGLGNAVPVLNQPSVPASQLVGTNGINLNLTGAGFLSGAVVNWNGTPLATTFVSSTQITATVPASNLATAGTAWINVVNPSPSIPSNIEWFPVSTPTVSMVFNLANLPASPGPQALAAADFNADGKLDLAVANAGAGTVSILLGNGDGTFAPRVDYPAGAQPVALVAGDFNGDGIPDLAVADQTGNTVSVLLGVGGGVFGPATMYPTGNGPAAIATGDFNGSGALDLVVANRFDNTVSILQGKGNGVFNAHVDYAAGQAPDALVVSDFNSDGKLDLAVGNDFYGGTVSVMLGNGDGTLQAPVTYATGDTVALAAADFNRDGKLDLLALNNQQQSLSVLLGNGDGTFQPAVVNPLQCQASRSTTGNGGTNCELHAGPTGLVLADLNGDGSVELAITNSNSGTVSILDGLGNGTFAFGAVDYLTAPNPWGVVAGDFNGDGAIDLAVAALASNAVSVLMQSAVPIFSSTSLNLGNVPVTGNAMQTLTVINGGSAPLVISAVSTSGSFSQTNNCGTPLASGASCSITVTFSPQSIGPVTGVLGIADNVPGSPQMISLSGTGVGDVTVNLSNTAVTGGNALSSNTIILAAPAPAGGAVVSLASSNPAVASVPASVTVAQGSTISPPFTINTTGVATNTTVTITASYGGSSASATLTVRVAGPGQVMLSKPSVISGLSLTGNVVVLNGQAPAGGTVVSLSSSNPTVAAVPSTVTVPAGSRTSAAFTIVAGFVTTATPVTITATFSSATATAAVTVNPVTVASVMLTPTTIIGGSPVNPGNIVTLNAPAPPGGAVVTLASSNPAVAATPSSITVAAGATKSPTFTITTTAVSSPVTVMISATYNNVTVSASLTVNPAAVYAVKLSATTVVGGGKVPGNQVQLNGVAPTGGDVISLSSSNPAVAAVPATVTVLAGMKSSQLFTITTKAVTTSTTVTISATYQGVTKTATLTVTP